MKYLILSLVASIFTLALPAVSLATGKHRPKIPTVDRVDLESYLGLWHEVRRIENEFQDNEPKPGDGVCYNVTAEYGILPKDKIRVVNTCYRQSRVEVAKANARTVQGSSNAKLKVNFTGIPLLELLGIGDGDYWILALGEKNSENMYSWVLVGSPRLDYGWILSRTQDLPESDIEQALRVAASVGYDVNLFKSFRR